MAWGAVETGTRRGEVLVVASDGDVAAVLEMLTSARVSCAYVNSTDEAAARLDAGDCDVVVLDRDALTSSKRAPASKTRRVGDLVVSGETFEARLGAAVVRLSVRESGVLLYLVENAHRTVSREELLVRVFGYRDGTIRTRTVDVHVQQLRAKLATMPGGASLIATVRGAGYRFVPPCA